MESAAAPASRERLSLVQKIVIGSGEHGVNLSLSALSLIYVYFLITHLGVRPGLAGAVPLIGRVVDAVTDPMMGRLSDLTRTRIGRRRPYLFFGALPFGLSFAMLWYDPGLDSDVATFVFCVCTYVFYSLASTVVAVPYAALIPEVVPDYDERTSVNAFRSGWNVLGTLIAAVGFQTIAESMAEGALGFFRAGAVLGVWVALPLMLVGVTARERPDFQKPVQVSLTEGFRMLFQHATYRRLSALYISGRIAMDVVGMALLFYFTYWLGRKDDFEITMALFLGTAILSLPIWVYIAERTDKHRVFIFGCLWWTASQLTFLAIQPEWPRWIMFVGSVFFAAGYAVVDMMPWAMLGEVVDEDELISGERREGVYAGSFTFFRKLAGAVGVFGAGLVLEFSGFVPKQQEQPESALWAIRLISAVGPALFLLLAALLARGYPLDRNAHVAIMAEIERRRSVEG